jgi:hypothetical protein
MVPVEEAADHVIGFPRAAMPGTEAGSGQTMDEASFEVVVGGGIHGPER